MDWKKDRAEIREFLFENPATVKQVVERGLANNTQRAGNHINRLAGLGRIRPQGFVIGESGRQSQVWGWWPVQYTQIRHEVAVTQALINLKAERIARQNVDPKIRPDAVFWKNKWYLLEMDMATETKKFLKQRVEKIASTKKPTPVVWVTFGEKRLETIKECCKPILDRCVFTTMANTHSLAHSLGQSQ